MRDIPDKTAVEILTEWLDLAKAGKLVAVPVAGVSDQGSAVTTFSKDIKLVGVAAVAILEHRLRDYTITRQESFP